MGDSEVINVLSNADLKKILNEWSYWDTKPHKSVSRKLRLPSALHDDIALIIQGVRRSGKSTLLSQLPRHYKIDYKKCFYCNFEDPRLLNNLDHKILSQIVAVARESINQKSPCYFFFDEIQNVKNWEKWLHSELERPKKNYYVLTGSNSSLLSGEFATSLTGRHITLELFPFSFSEYQLLFPKHSLEKYLCIGGFPRPITFERPLQLLQEYFNDIILRDVLKRVNARSADAIRQVVKMSYEACGSELSYRKIAAATGLTVDTVKSYLEACENAYLLFACQFFSFSEKKRSNRQKKYYPIDPGLRNAIISNITNDYGKNFELLVYLRLRVANEQVYYWQEATKGEVDFVTVNGKEITPYQVTWHEPVSRHYKSLDYFYELYPYANEAIFITKENALDYV